MPLDTIGDPENKLKKNGYYYAELEKEAYFFHKTQYGGYASSGDPYQQKLIRPVILYDNGAWTQKPDISGMKENFVQKNESGIPDDNSVFGAKRFFEYLILQPDNLKGKLGMLYNKGVFKITGNTIVVQYYSAIGLVPEREYLLMEKRGEILNDSTFIINAEYDYSTKKTTLINEKYFFQAHKFNPAPENYILLNRKKFRTK